MRYTYENEDGLRITVTRSVEDRNTPPTALECGSDKEHIWERTIDQVGMSRGKNWKYRKGQGYGND